MMWIKRIRLKVGRFIHNFFSRLPRVFSYILLILSVLVCMMILVPDCLDRIPVFSYCISEHELPITYELCGKVRIFNKNGDEIKEKVEVFAGGYRISTLTSTDFTLKFSAPMTREAFVVIRYKVDDETREFTKCLLIEDGEHVIREEFVVYV